MQNNKAFSKKLMDRLHVLLRHVIPTPSKTFSTLSPTIQSNFVTIPKNCSFAPQMYCSTSDGIIASEFYEENVTTGILEKIWPL